MIDLRIHGLGTLPSTNPQGEAFKPDLSLLDRTLRRGLSDVTRLFFHVAQAALTHAGVSARDVRVVFASAFGEVGTAEAMLLQALEDNSASPARFRNSVHNTAPGLLSISAQNTLASTAISAGHDSVAMGLLESQLCLQEDGRPVLLVCADEAVPASLCDETLGAVAVAFVLSRGEIGRGARLTQLQRHTSRASGAQDAHPLAGAETLARALNARERGTVLVGSGPSPYAVEVDARDW